MSQKLRHMELFAGAGGGVLGGMLAGVSTRCAVELNPYRRAILKRRMAEGFLPRMAIRRRVEGIEAEDWAQKIDIVSGGFPCQDISAAGRGLGIDAGKRSGLWREFRRVVCELRPHFVFVENSPRLTTHGLGRVLGDLAGAIGARVRRGSSAAANVDPCGGKAPNGRRSARATGEVLQSVRAPEADQSTCRRARTVCRAV